MVTQAIQTSTETGVGRAIVQKITDELNLEIAALVPNVRFLYELAERMERQRFVVPGTPFEKSSDDAEVFMSDASKLQQGTLVADITKHFSNIRSLRARLYAENVDHSMLGAGCLKPLSKRMPSDLLGIYLAQEQVL